MPPAQPSGLGGLADARLVAEATGEHRRRHRLEMGLASHRGVERFEAPGGIEQQRRSVAAARAGERDLRAQPLQPRALKLVERGELGGRQQLERRVRCRSVELRLRGGQGPPAPLRRIGRQLRRALPGTPQPRPRPHGRCARSAERSNSAATASSDTHRRVSAMPRPTIGIGIRIGRLGQRPMRVSPLGRGRRPVDRGSHQWMPEADTGSDLDQLRVFGRGERARSRCRAARAARQTSVASPIGSAAASSSSRCVAARQLTGALAVAAPRGGAARSVAARSPKPPASSAALMPRGRSSRASGLPRVSATMRSRTRSSSRPGTALVEQRARILLASPRSTQLGQAVEVVPGVRLADGDHDRDRLRQQPSRDEAEDQS